MPNFTTLWPIIIFLPVIIFAFVAILVSATHFVVAWSELQRDGRAAPARAAALIVISGRARPDLGKRDARYQPADGCEVWHLSNPPRLIKYSFEQSSGLLPAVCRVPRDARGHPT